MRSIILLIALYGGFVSATANALTTPPPQSVSTPPPSGTDTTSCKPTTLRNGGFESGRIKPWIPSGEGEPAKKAIKISTDAHTGNYALEYSINYAINHALYPDAYLIQYVNACGKPQVLTLWYKVVSTASDTDSFIVQVYDSYFHNVFVYDTVDFNNSRSIDSHGNRIGQWHKLGPYDFKPYKDKIIFTVFLIGSGNGGTGIASLLMDDVSLSSQ